MRLVYVFAWFLICLDLSAEPSKLDRVRMLARVEKPNLPFRFLPVGQNLLLMGQGKFWKVPKNLDTTLELKPATAWGAHYWGFSLVTAGKDSALACVDGGNRFLSIERISAPGVPQVFEHRFDANKQDSCGAIAPGTQPYQAWVAGLQNQTLIEMRKGRGGWRVEERTRSYVGAFLHAFVQNRMVGLWGTLSPDNFGVFAFDPKDSRLLLAPSGEDRSADQWVPRGFADDMAVVSNGVFLVQPGKQFITKVELSPTGSQRAQAKIENWKTQLLLPYQIEVTSRCALVLGYLNESGTSAAEWISFESDFRETQVLGSHPEAREGLRYMSLSQGRLFGSDSRGVFEYMDFQIPGQCE